jgi:hypothetical protein
LAAYNAGRPEGQPRWVLGWAALAFYFGSLLLVRFGHPIQ